MAKTVGSFSQNRDFFPEQKKTVKNGGISQNLWFTVTKNVRSFQTIGTMNTQW